MWSDQPTPFRPVLVRRRYLDVAEQILAALADGTLVPGDPFPSDRELSQNMQVSRSVVREALLALELLGVVRIEPGEGVYVTGGAQPSAITSIGSKPIPGSSLRRVQPSNRRSRTR